MIRWLFVFTLCAPGLAMAQTQIYPPPYHGQGTMSVTTSSTAINSSNVTVTGASPAFPTGISPSSYLRVKVQPGSSVRAAVCWSGGTCTWTSGDQLAIGQSRTNGVKPNFSTNPPTIISESGTASVEVEW